MSPTLHIQLLGEFQLQVDDRPRTVIATPRLQSLLAYLLLHRSAPQSRQHLAFLFWPDSSERAAHTNLSSLLHQLRRTLPAVDCFLVADRWSLHWQTGAPLTLDVTQFETALARAEQAPHPGEQHVALAEVVKLYTGDLLPTCYDEWILPHRERLRRAFLSALERLMSLLEHDQEYEAAIACAREGA